MKLIVGTRGSKLSLTQTNAILDSIRAIHPDLKFEVKIVKTLGDEDAKNPLFTIDRRGIFEKELGIAIANGEIDLAVHSLKDLPTELPARLALGAVCQREDVRDVFIPHPRGDHRSLHDLPRGARVATGSLRRKCQLLGLRGDLEIVDIRGNLNTRFRKLEESDWHGMILARAGVVRLGWTNAIGETLSADLILPAVGQGALGVEIRADDKEIRDLVCLLEHGPTRQAVTAERTLLHSLEGGCQVPIGAYGRIDKDANGSVALVLDAMVGSLDGRTIVRGTHSGDPRDPEAVGMTLAEMLQRAGADGILRAIRVSNTPLS